MRGRAFLYFKCEGRVTGNLRAQRKELFALNHTNLSTNGQDRITRVCDNKGQYTVKIMLQLTVWTDTGQKQRKDFKLTTTTQNQDLLLIGAS